MLTVVPHAGTWIEISSEVIFVATIAVVPHAGTWIEITQRKSEDNGNQSFPTRERGLK